MTGYSKAHKVIDKYINKAIRERDKTGYRENLGYEYYQTVKTEIDKIDGLAYSDIFKLMAFFIYKCDSV